MEVSFMLPVLHETTEDIIRRIRREIEFKHRLISTDTYSIYSNDLIIGGLLRNLLDLHDSTIIPEVDIKPEEKK
jgi:hypothetical protein